MYLKIEISSNEFEEFMKKLQKTDAAFRWTMKTNNGILTKANITDDK